MAKMADQTKLLLRQRKAKSKQPFSNQSILEPKERKPHICKRNGLWRVSAMPRTLGGKVSKAFLYRFIYNSAHDFARKLNREP